MIRPAKPDATDAIVSSGPFPPDGTMEGPPVGLGATRDELRRLLVVLPWHQRKSNLIPTRPRVD
jgi:hypothetical protein